MDFEARFALTFPAYVNMAHQLTRGMDMQNSLPEFSKWINPVLRALNELGGSARPREVVELVAKNEHVTDDVLDQLNPAGGQRFPNQVHWARFYLADSGYIDRSKHGVWKLTDGGVALSSLDDEALEQLVKSVQGAMHLSPKYPRRCRCPVLANL